MAHAVDILDALTENKELRRLAIELSNMGAEVDLQHRKNDYRLKAVFIVPKTDKELAAEQKARKAK